MLSHVRGAETVLADIETLDLGRTFPVVVLASNFLNAPEQEELDAVLGACARHVDDGGQVLLERMPPEVGAEHEDEHDRRRRDEARTTSCATAHSSRR